MLRRATALLVIGANAAGCVTHLPLANDYAGPDERPAEITGRYAYPTETIRNRTVAIREENRRFIVREVVFSVDLEGEPEEISLEYYDIGGTGKTPVILVLPILNGENFFARQFARYFAARGYAAIIVQTNQKHTLLEDMAHAEHAIRRSIVKHRKVLDWVVQNDEFDATRIGVFGASLGGLNATLLTALDDRIAAAAPALAGGDLPTIFVASEERRVAEAVDAAMIAKGLTREQMHDYLRDEIETDPIMLARYIDAANVLMVLARRDKTIPYATQETLREKMGNPEAIYLPTGHLSSAVYLPYLKRRVYRFFNERFADS
jgi:dienelactone hydrolase